MGGNWGAKLWPDDAFHTTHVTAFEMHTHLGRQARKGARALEGLHADRDGHKEEHNHERSLHFGRVSEELLLLLDDVLCSFLPPPSAAAGFLWFVIFLVYQMMVLLPSTCCSVGQAAGVF